MSEEARSGGFVYAYCIFCRTQRCKMIARLLEIKGVQKAFSPQILQKHRYKGENKVEMRDLLPGYVFFFHPQPLTDYTILLGIDGVIRRIGRADELYQLQGPDRAFALSLLDKQGQVGLMRTVEVGEVVQLEDPLFASVKGRVTKLDRRKERARVDFVFNGSPCYTWVALEAVKTERKESPLLAGMAEEAVPEEPAPAAPEEGRGDIPEQAAGKECGESPEQAPPTGEE